MKHDKTLPMIDRIGFHEGLSPGVSPGVYTPRPNSYPTDKERGFPPTKLKSGKIASSTKNFNIY